jgi:NADH-quinone oxidoreductase subunit F
VTFAELRDRARSRFEQLKSGTQPVLWFGIATCGVAAGAAELLEAVERELEEMGTEAALVPVGCIGTCYLEPLMDIEKPGRARIVYGQVTPEKARAILRSYLRDDDPRPDLALGTLGDSSVPGIPRFFDLPMLKPQVRIVTRNLGLINPEDIDHYLAVGGYEGLQRALGTEPEAVIEEITRSGLRGRGGAGFPTGQKWRYARGAPGSPKYLICNADEGDPGAFMDRSVLEGDPHSVLEGMLIAAYAIGAGEGYVYVRSEYPLAIKRLTVAMKQMRDYGLLGTDILGSGFSFDIQIKEGAGAFVCGEETALIASIEGKRGMPNPRPPFPATSGLWGKPTNINNVETLANVPAILTRGADWFAGFGTERSAGTKTFALTGKVERSGLIEVPMGMTLGEVIFGVGGGILGDLRFKAVQTGGPSGGCLPARLANLPIDYEALAEAGSIMGSGGLVVLDENTCIVDMARYFLTFTQRESCGKCPPCRLGTRQMLAILEDICAGKGRPQDIQLLQELGSAVKAASLCGLGQSAPNPVLSTIRYFREELAAHIHERRCSAAACWGLFRAPCEHTCPAGVNVPIYVTHIAAGEFEEALDVIKQTMPFAGVCGRVCHHPCETRCMRSQTDDPVAIRALKRFAADAVMSGGRGARVEAAPFNGHQVAVIGGGPAGLTAAWELARRGYRVKLYEALPVLGGMLAAGIPEYRLPRDMLRREIDEILALGVEAETGVRVGRDIPFQEILGGDYDAVFVAIGAWRGARLGVPGEDLPGVIQAIDLLREANLAAEDQAASLPALGERVAVVGGGNAAMDAARTAVRLGCKEVRLLYRRTRHEMPAQAEEIEEAINEGVRMHFLAAPRRILGAHRVEAIECAEMRLSGFDESGRWRPVAVEGGEFSLPVDTVILAVGQQVDPTTGLPVPVSDRGRLVVDPDTLQTTLPGVYAGGDAVTGPATVIDAIAHGLRAARAIDYQVRGVVPTPVVLADPHPAPADDEEIVERRRVPHARLAVDERLRGFSEVELCYSAEAALEEAGRCLRCHWGEHTAADDEERAQ